MNARLTCYGGVEEIGGNKVLLEDGQTRLLLDFGTSFGRRQGFFNEYLCPRASRGLLDPLALELIPPLQGLYQTDLAPPGVWERFRPAPLYRDLQRAGVPAVDGVLVSHPHLDHNGDISCLDPSIPVYSTSVCAFIARVMQITGQSGFEREWTWVCPRQWDEEAQALRTVPRVPHKARRQAFLDGPLTPEALEWWEALPGLSRSLDIAPPVAFNGTVGGLELRWWPVDHSIPGAAAFAVRTSSGWIAYSGDIRFHGAAGPAMHTFVAELAALHPTALLCEGTHLTDGPQVTEATLGDNALDVVRQAAGRLVVADFAPRNVERLWTFVAVARECGRRLAIQPKDAYLLEALALADLTAFAEPSSMQELVLYADPKSAPRPWETALRRRWASRLLSAADVSASPADYILCFSLWDANDLLDLQGIEGGVYLYANSRAYDEEQAIDLERLRNWVRFAGLRLVGDPDDPDRLPLHASGHASGPQLRDLVLRVNPRLLIPIHTEDPRWWVGALAGTHTDVAPPVRGQPMALP